jgi:hypothetical protein
MRTYDIRYPAEPKSKEGLQEKDTEKESMYRILLVFCMVRHHGRGGGKIQNSRNP